MIEKQFSTIVAPFNEYDFGHGVLLEIQEYHRVFTTGCYMCLGAGGEPYLYPTCMNVS
jgi:hypothetical protein